MQFINKGDDFCHFDDGRLAMEANGDEWDRLRVELCSVFVWR